MLIEVDVIKDVVLLLDQNLLVVDAFQAVGKTPHTAPSQTTHFTLKSFVVPAGYCAVCGCHVSEIAQRCSSSGGFHAFVGLPENAGIPPQHLAANRAISLITVSFEDIELFLEKDHLYPISQISKAFLV